MIIIHIRTTQSHKPARSRPTWTTTTPGPGTGQLLPGPTRVPPWQGQGQHGTVPVSQTRVVTGQGLARTSLGYPGPSMVTTRLSRARIRSGQPRPRLGRCQGRLARPEPQFGHTQAIQKQGQGQDITVRADQSGPGIG